MNTKIKFYCINISNGGFSKIIFETIVDGIIEDSTDWVDKNIDKHYSDFYLDIVLDWKVISTESTKKHKKETKIIDTVNGHLFFEDELDYLFYKLGKTVHEKNEIKSEIKKLKKEKKVLPPKQKDYPSVWIEPSGEVHELAFAEHEKFASDWLDKNEPEIFEAKFGFTGKDKYDHKYCHEILEDLGWIRILGWVDPPRFVLPIRITPKQKESLRTYCINNNVSYNAWPENLKS